MQQRFVASFAQRRLWFLDSLNPGSSAYIIPAAWQLQGTVDRQVLEDSLNELVARHETLRTTFEEGEHELFQVIADRADVRVKFLDASGSPDPQGLAGRLLAEEARAPFDLRQGPLLRASLIRLGDQSHTVLLTLHHIICDAWSMGVLKRELTALYLAFKDRRPSPLQALDIQYADYAAWQHQWMQGKGPARELAYWTHKLADAQPRVELAADRASPSSQGRVCGIVALDVPADISHGLAALGRSAGATLFMTLAALLAALLQRHSRQSSFNIAYPTAGRTRPETEGLIGLFVNTLLLRVDVEGHETFLSLLDRVRSAILEGDQHQNVPFERIVGELNLRRDAGRMPLSNVMLSLFTEDSASTEAAPSLLGLAAQTWSTPPLEPKFDLSLDFVARDGQLLGAFEYDAGQFDHRRIERLAGHFRVLATAVLANPQQPLQSLPLLTPSEQEELVLLRNATTVEFPDGLCLHQLFEAQVQLNPHRTAVRWRGQALTYGEVNARANRLAHYLRGQGAAKDTLLALCMDRSPALIVALLAILKSGAAYLPLDPGYPQERLRYMLDDSGAGLLLTEDLCLSKIALANPAVRILLHDAAEIAGYPEENPRAAVGARHLAYCLYTSGSTGTPKAVALSHGNAVAFVRWALSVFGGGALHQTLAVTSLCFDLSVFEIFAPLANGDSIVLCENALSTDDFEQEAAPTLLNTVPSALRAILDQAALPSSLQAVNLAGEPLPPQLVNRLREVNPAIQVRNLYGPTETTTYSTCCLVPEGFVDRVTLGRPIANTQIYILDAALNLMPDGAIGEVFIAGAGVAHGYLGRPGMTADRFVPDPFGQPGSRLYRTGDLARYSSEGVLEYLGRLDKQVKIRGYRIELGEVEKAILKHPAVREVVVSARESAQGDLRLVAYLVFQADSFASVKDLRTELSSLLPDYMVPSAWVVLEAIPLTPNGKTDLSRLPPPDGAGMADDAGPVPPRTPTERVLGQIWSEVLGIAPIGLRDNFFSLGGHSLLVNRVVLRIRKEFGVAISTQAMFEALDLEMMASHIDDLQ